MWRITYANVEHFLYSRNMAVGLKVHQYKFDKVLYKIVFRRNGVSIKSTLEYVFLVPQS